MRLAFAVAAHLDPEVLIIDEVLAVGDYEFQQRCMGRIEEISELGPHRDLRLARHAGDHAALRSRLLARRAAAWSAEGRAEDVVSQYLQGASGVGRGGQLRARRPRRGPSPFGSLGARVVDASGETTHSVDVREPIGIEIDGSPCSATTEPLFPKIKLGNDRGEVVFNAFDTDARWRDRARAGHLHVHRLDPGQPPQRGRHRASTSPSPPSAAPKPRQPHQRPGARPLPRPRPRARRHGQGPLHGPAAGRRAAAARVDDGVRPSSGAPTRRRNADDRVGRASASGDVVVAVRERLERRGRAVGRGREHARLRPSRSRRGAGRSCCRG